MGRARRGKRGGTLSPRGPKRTVSKAGVRYRSATGRFISRATYKEQRSLFQAAKQEKPKLGWRDSQNRAIKNTKGAQDWKRPAPKRAQAYYDESIALLDAGKLPPPTATRYSPPYYFYFWRFQGVGIEGVTQAEEQVALLLYELEKYKGLLAQGRITTGYGAKAESVGTGIEPPREVAKYFSKWRKRKSAAPLWDHAEDGGTLYFEVMAHTTKPIGKEHVGSVVAGPNPRKPRRSKKTAKKRGRRARPVRRRVQARKGLGKGRSKRR